MAAGTAFAVQSSGPASMLVRFGAALLITVVGVGLLIWQRKRLPAAVATRSKRLFVEVLLLGALEFVVGILTSAADLRGALKGKISAEDNRILWALPFAVAAVILFQAFSVLRSDTAATDLAALRTAQDVLRTQLGDARAQRDFFSIVSRAFLRVVRSSENA